MDSQRVRPTWGLGMFRDFASTSRAGVISASDSVGVAICSILREKTGRHIAEVDRFCKMLRMHLTTSRLLPLSFAMAYYLSACSGGGWQARRGGSGGGDLVTTSGS